ncbi:MAG: N-acetyltransferase family protein [Ekhidna sp.]
MIRSAELKDFADIVKIYNHYVLNSHATFEIDPISVDDMMNRVQKIQHAFNLPWIVLVIENQIVGYAYATQWKPREAYLQTAEVSVYLEKNATGNGYGRLLYQELIERLKHLRLHAILAGISLPNDASVKLHESLGFKKVGQLKEVGKKFDRWIDVGYWELIFE